VSWGISQQEKFTPQRSDGFRRHILLRNDAESYPKVPVSCRQKQNIAGKTSWAHKGRVTLCRSVLGNFARRKIYFRNIIKRISATRTPNDAKSESKIRASCRQKEQHILAPWQSCFHDPRTPLPSLCLQDAMDLEGPGECAEKAVSQCLYNRTTSMYRT